MSLQIIILAGGKGTRIKPVLGDTPKILAKIKDRLFIDWMMLWINSWNIQFSKPIILSTCIGHDFIAEYSKDKAYPIKCEKEITPLGTFGAVANVSCNNFAENYLILNGDTIFKANFKKTYESFISGKRLKPLIFLKESINNKRYGGYKKTSKGWIFSHKNTNFISLGAFFISREILLSRWTEATNLKFEKKQINTFQNQEWMIDKHCLGDKPSSAIVLNKDIPFLDIGVPNSLEEAQNYIPKILQSQRVIINNKL